MSVKIEIEGDSEEAVALALLHLVARAEGKADVTGDFRGAGREWVLDTYAECLEAVMGDRMPPDGEEEDGEDDEGDEEDEDEEDEDKEDRDEEGDDAAERPTRPAGPSPILDPATGLPVRSTDPA
jgi:cobalamin biosynthesis protein CobT